MLAMTLKYVINMTGKYVKNMTGKYVKNMRGNSRRRMAGNDLFPVKTFYSQGKLGKSQTVENGAKNCYRTSKTAIVGPTK